MNKIKPNYAIHPGNVLGDILWYRGMSINELGKMTGCDKSIIIKIIIGEISINHEIATKLEILGPPAIYWLNLEKDYQKSRN